MFRAEQGNLEVKYYRVNYRAYDELADDVLITFLSVSAI